MAAHGRHKEGLCSQALEVLADCSQGENDIGNAPAAGRQGNRLAGLDPSTQVKVRQGLADGGSNVLDSRPLELLPNSDHLRVRHGKPT